MQSKKGLSKYKKPSQKKQMLIWTFPILKPLAGKEAFFFILSIIISNFVQKVFSLKHFTVLVFRGCIWCYSLIRKSVGQQFNLVKLPLVPLFSTTYSFLVLLLADNFLPAQIRVQLDQQHKWYWRLYLSGQMENKPPKPTAHQHTLRAKIWLFLSSGNFLKNDYVV